MVMVVSTSGMFGQGRILPSFASKGVSIYSGDTMYGYANFREENKPTAKEEKERAERLKRYKKEWEQKRKRRLAAQGLTTKGTPRKK